MGNKIITEPIEKSLDFLGSSQQAEYIQRYAMALGAKQIVVESEYIDKDYLLDFQNFYSRSFGPKVCTTTRVHFFSDGLEGQELIAQLLNPASTRLLNDNYVGFAVVKPVPDRIGRLVIGRTILRNYPVDGGDHKRTYIGFPQRSNLFGHELRIWSLPFQSQDTAVGACASAALWCAFNQLFHLFEVPRGSLSEITTEANEGVILESRSFPSQGLTTQQMCGYIRLKGLELEHFNFPGPANGVMGEFITLALRTYIQAGVPIIAKLAMINPGEAPDYHGVVISGISLSEDGKLQEIYAHDDQVGPYASVFSNDMFQTWKYGKEGSKAWTEYDTIKLDSLIVPLYHKFRLPFIEVWRQWVELNADKTLSNQEVFLYEASKYKSRLLNLAFPGMEKILTMPLPHYIWVFKATHQDGIIEETVLDATAPYPTIIATFER